MNKGVTTLNLRSEHNCIFSETTGPGDCYSVVCYYSTKTLEMHALGIL